MIREWIIGVGRNDEETFQKVIICILKEKYFFQKMVKKNYKIFSLMDWKKPINLNIVIGRSSFKIVENEQFWRTFFTFKVRILVWIIETVMLY